MTSTEFEDANGRTDRVPALLEALAGRATPALRQEAARTRVSIELWASIRLAEALESADFGCVPAAVPALPPLLALARTDHRAVRLLALVRETAHVEARLTVDEARATFLEACRQVILTSFRANVPFLANLLVSDDEHAAGVTAVLWQCSDAVELVWGHCETLFSSSGAALCTASLLPGLGEAQRHRVQRGALVLLDQWRESPPPTLGASFAAVALISGDAFESGFEALLTGANEGWYLRFGNRYAVSHLRDVLQDPDRVRLALELARRTLERADGVTRVRTLERLMQLELGEPVLALVKEYAPSNDPDAAADLREFMERFDLSP